MVDNVIVGGRRTGKTSELIRISAAEWKYIVVPTAAMVHCIAKQASDMGLEIPYPVCIKELPMHSRFIDDVLVDESQALLAAMIGKPIRAMTVCSDGVLFCDRPIDSDQWESANPALESRIKTGGAE